MVELTLFMNEIACGSRVSLELLLARRGLEGAQELRLALGVAQ